MPSAWSQPSPSPTNDHADGATLGRWDANASQRTRRPGMKEPSSKTAHTRIHNTLLTRFLFAPLAAGATRCIVRYRYSTMTEAPKAEQCNKWHPVRDLYRIGCGSAREFNTHGILRARCPHHNGRRERYVRSRPDSWSIDGICVYLCDPWATAMMRCLDAVKATVARSTNLRLAHRAGTRSRARPRRAPDHRFLRRGRSVGRAR